MSNRFAHLLVGQLALFGAFAKADEFFEQAFCQHGRRIAVSRHKCIVIVGLLLAAPQDLSVMPAAFQQRFGSVVVALRDLAICVTGGKVRGRELDVIVILGAAILFIGGAVILESLF